MPPKVDPSQITAEFGHELEAERQQLLRRRFLWYTGTVAAVSALFSFFPSVIGIALNNSLFWWIRILLSAAVLTTYAMAFVYVAYTQHTRWPLIKMCMGLIVISGMLNLMGGQSALGELEDSLTPKVQRVSERSKQEIKEEIRSQILGKTKGGPATINAPSFPADGADPNSAPSAVDPDENTFGAIVPTPGMPGTIQLSKKDTDRIRAGSAAWAGLSGANSIFWSHFLACLFLPLTPRESIRPLIPLLVLNAGLILILVIRGLVGGSGWPIFFMGVGTILFSPLIGLPGLGIVCWRDSSFKEGVTNRLMRGRYVEMHRELVDARRIHESLFPRPIRDSDITLTYAYEPMRQIGGDYLFCKHTLGPAGNQRLNVVMLDVTGHGIPAALTVNRLHGELERIFAEQPNTDPGQVLRLLNRYVNLTLAGHWVYVTGLCMRVDSAAGTLEYASGGHPPAFLYAANGTLDELHSTAIILGAVPDAEFDAAMETRRFMPGDRVIAYTDGAFECRDRQGNQLRIAGIRALISKGPATTSEWPAAIIKSVEQFRFGPPPDDTLVVELFHSLSPQKKEAKPDFFKARSGIFRAINN